MAKSKESPNLFYPLLLIAGVAFLLTACAYGVMAFRDLRIESDTGAGRHEFMQFMHEYGGRLMLGELGALAVATLGLIGLDRWRFERQQRMRGASAESVPASNPPTGTASREALHPSPETIHKD